MEKRLVMTLPFTDPSWDALLESWLRGTLDANVREALLERLSVDAKFREEACEWIKALRDAGWSGANGRMGRAA